MFPSFAQYVFILSVNVGHEFDHLVVSTLSAENLYLEPSRCDAPLRVCHAGADVTGIERDGVTCAMESITTSHKGGSGRGHY